MITPIENQIFKLVLANKNFIKLLPLFKFSKVTFWRRRTFGNLQISEAINILNILGYDLTITKKDKTK